MWAELETYIFPKGAHTVGEYLEWLENPVATTSSVVIRNVPIPPPVGPNPPCVPGVGGSQDGDALHAVIDIAGPSCDLEGASLYRAVGAGPFKHLAFVTPGSSHLDAGVRHGVTYRYRAYGYDQYGRFSAASPITTIAVANTNPPEVPGNVVATALSQGALVSWSLSPSYDVVGYEVSISDSSGGPYLKMNGSLLPMTSTSFMVSGLDPATTYYVVLEAVDDAGNKSGPTFEIDFTPLP